MSEIEKYGYQPQAPSQKPEGDVQGGYQPEKSVGDNPANQPSPPGDE